MHQPALVAVADACAAPADAATRYRRRRPENTVLYRVVQDHLESFLAEARERSEDGSGAPWFVERELRRFLECGILAHGFARVRCQSCGLDRMVAFSCCLQPASIGSW